MGLIYLLTNNEGQYKIGITRSNVNKRVKQLQTGNSNVIDVVAEFESKFYTKIESTLHNRHALKRLKGEWFDLEKKDIEGFISECQSIHDNLQFLEESGNPFI